MDYNRKSWDEQLYQKFLHELMNCAASEENKEFYKKSYNDCKKEVIGIKIPVLREISKEILKGNSSQFIKVSISHDDYVEEVIIQGFVIAMRKDDFNEKLNNITTFIPKITNWAICDSFVPSLKCVRKNRDTYLKYILKYFNSSSEFELRFFVISLLCYYIEDDSIDFVLGKLNNIKLDYYYVKMAVAWTLCDCYIYYNEKTFEFFKKNNLDKFTQNKAISKIMDSYRVSKEDKEKVKKLRIN